MLSIFHRVKSNKELEVLADRIASNAANNYKDAAQDYFRQYESRFEELKAEGRLNQRQIEHYGALLSDFRGRMKDFSHKDQKPYWT